MSAKTVSQRTARKVWTAVSTPAMVLHELTHALVAQPWAERSAVVFDGASAAVHIEWSDDPPAWGVTLAHLAPTLLGTLVGLIGLVQLATSPPTGLNQWLVAGAIAAYWTIYVAPSGDDRTVRTDEQHADHDRSDS
jgi:hypothetical protein